MNPLDILLLVPLAGFLLTLLLPKSGTGPIRIFATKFAHILPERMTSVRASFSFGVSYRQKATGRSSRANFLHRGICRT